MKRSMILMVMYHLLWPALPSLSQTIKPYKFLYQSDAASHNSLQVLTEVSAGTSTSVRLFFKGTELGTESYLLLEGTDGARQELRKRDLENWNFSSAYFNGNSVKVSLFSGKTDKNKIEINGIKVNTGKNQSSTRGAVAKASSTNRTSTGGTIDYQALPHAAAVGRFTNGTNSFGTGWIAPNGAIVTSQLIAYNYAIMGDYDIIEFNIPSSDSYGHVNHPAPDDQYPISKSNWNHGNESFEFKRKYDYDISKEDDYGTWHTTWAMIEALPNSTGFRPGERQQQHFQVATSPGTFTLESQNVWVDVFHYGEITTDLLDGSQFRVLKRHVTKLQPPKEYLSDLGTGDRDNFVLYNKDQGGDITLSDSDSGAPIAYSEFNIAIGVHNDFFFWPPSVGTGFRDDNMLNALDNFFSSSTVYVDRESYWDGSTGSIDKPYFTVGLAAENAAVSETLSIAKGSYNETLYITKPLTLKAPVGHVVIGQAAELNGRKATLPQALFEDEAINFQSAPEEEGAVGFSLTSFPNPFQSSSKVNYSLSESTQVKVSVYDKLGGQVQLLMSDLQSKGNHAVVWDGTIHGGRQALPGIYIIRLETPSESASIKVIKQ